MDDFSDLGSIPVDQKPVGIQDFADLGAQPSIKPTPEPNMGSVKKFFKGNLAEANKDANPKVTEAKDYWDDLQAGWQNSTLALGITRQSLPDKVLPENADRMARILSMAGNFAGDIPAMLAGGVGGAAVGSLAGKVGMKVGASAGAFAFPAGLRQALIDHYKKGDIQSPEDFVDRALGVFHETVKGAALGATVGAVGMGTGALLPEAASGILKLGATTAAETAALTTVSAAMDGRLPKPSEFVDNGAFMALMHGVTSGAGRLAEPIVNKITNNVAEKAMDVYAKTNIQPHEVSEMAANDPVLRQEMLSKDPTTPPSLAKAVDPSLKVPEISLDKEGELKSEPLPEEKDPSFTKPSDEEPPKRSAAVEKVLSTIGEQTEKPKEKLSYDKLYYSILDDKDPLKNLTKSVLGEEAIGTREDPYGLARSMGSVARKADLIIEKGPRDAETMEKTGTPGLKEIWDKVEDGDEYIAYRKAKHSIDLEKNGITSGVDIDAAKAVVRELGPKYKDIAKQEVQFNNDNIDYARDLGVISKDSAKAIKAKWENYASMSRVLGTDELEGTGSNKNLTPSNPLEAIKGSERQTVDPRISAIKNTHALIAMAEKNRVMSAVGNIIRTANEKGDFSFGRLDESITPEDQENINALKKDGYSDKEASALSTLRGGRVPLRDDQISFMEDGQRITVSDVPKELVSAVKGLDASSAGTLLKMLAGPSKTLRTGTLSNPAFGIRHFFRQEILATTLSKDLHIPVLETVKGMSGMLGDDFDRWIMHGGGGDSIGAIDNDYIKSKIYDLDEKTNFLKDKINQTANILQFTKHAIEITDEARTFQKFRNRESALGDPWKAQFDARDTGIDVQRQGANMRAYSMLDPFQTIRIQGLDLIGRRLADDPLGTSAKLMATITLPSAVLWYANHDKDWYKELTDRDRDTNWHFAVGDPEADGHVIRVPKPFEPGIVFGALPERLLGAYFTDNPRAFKDFQKTIAESVTPGYVPAFAQPIIEHFANKSFLTKSPLIPHTMEQVLPEYQYKPYTSDVAKIIASGLRLIPSDMTQKPGSLGSPAIVDNYIQAWAGGAGKLLVAGVDSALEKSGLADKMGIDYIKNKPDPTWADNPFFKSFALRYPSESGKSVNDFFDRFEETAARVNTIQMLAKKGDLGNWEKESAVAMAENQFSKLDGLKSAISTQMKLTQTVYNLPENVMDKTQKRQMLDQYYTSITNTAKLANQMMDELDKNMKQVEK